MNEVSELFELAKKSTPGRNYDRLDSCGGGIKYQCIGNDGSLVLQCDHKNNEYGFIGPKSMDDEAFFLACKPETIIAIAEEFMMLQEQLTATTNILKSAGIDADTVQAGVVELKAQRDALAANEGYKHAFYEMAEILGIGACPDSPKNVFELVIKPKLEALMKERGKLASENLTLANLITSWPQERCPVTGAVTDVQPDDIFPETNTYINCVRAEGVEMFIGELSELFRSLKPGGKPWQAVKGIAMRATSFAAQLRAGKADKTHWIIFMKDGSHD